MFNSILENTNVFLAQVIGSVQLIVLLALCIKYVFIKHKKSVFLQVFGVLLLYLCLMAGIKLMLDFIGVRDQWYHSYIVLSLMLVPIIEGLMYSLYRQGTKLPIVLKRIFFAECPFIAIILIDYFVGLGHLFKPIAYTYLVLYSSIAFVVTFIRVRLFSAQIKQAYADVEARTLTWVRPILIITIILMAAAAICAVFWITWFRVAFDAVTIFMYGAVGWFIMEQKPVDTEMVDDTRVYLQGDMVDRVQVRVRDNNGNYSFVDVDKKISRDGLVLLGKKLDKFMTSSVACLKHDFTIAELAQKMEVDNVFLACYIANELETDFFTYVNDFRIDYASDMLRRHPEWSVETVCEQSGFKDMKFFLKLFAKRYLCTPEEYRQTKPINLEEACAALYNMCNAKLPGFINRLQQYEPSLNAKDVVNCLLIVLGYTLPRAAMFMGTSQRAMEISQERLRAKLGLLHTDSLEAFVRRV